MQANKPSPRLKAPTTLSTALASAITFTSKRRRLVGSVNEAEAIAAFRSLRAYFNAREPDSSSSKGSSNSEGDSLAKPSRKRRRNSYFKEKKLQAITYITSIDMQKKGGLLGELIPISLLYASKQLEVSRKSLQE